MKISYAGPGLSLFPILYTRTHQSKSERDVDVCVLSCLQYMRSQLAREQLWVAAEKSSCTLHNATLILTFNKERERVQPRHKELVLYT